MIDHRKTFRSALEELNPDQRKAVQTIEGPVLVIAGPGTGKTQILAARIGYILAETDSTPENILCLTYTDAGAIAMRQRLLQLIGPDAYRVSVSTFHAFCNNVIQDNLDVFGIRAVEPISELEQVELLHDLIDAFDRSHPLKKWSGEVYTETLRLKNLFELMKKEGWTAEYIAQKVDEYVSGLPDDPEFQYKRKYKEFNKGDPNPNKIDAVKEKLARLKAAAGEFPRYQMMMEERGRYDYDDMILWVLNKFKKDQYLLLNYQEQFQYFLVDEYQDTNGVQNEILNVLTGYWDVPNVFVVGDDDQSIYRFQGANVANILDFYHRHKEHISIVMLKDNYRSSQNILNASMNLINRNQERLVEDLSHLGLSKNLEAKSEQFAQSRIKPTIVQYYNEVHEQVDIARQIEKLYENEQDLGEVAVLYLKHAQAKDLSDFLERKGIPINIRRNANILESLMIQQLIAVLRYLSGEHTLPHSRDDLLFEIMHFAFFEIEPIEIARMAYRLRKSKGGKKVFYRNAIRPNSSQSQGDLFTSNTNSSTNMIQLSRNLEHWIAQIGNIPIPMLVEKIITHGGLLTLIMNDPDKTWKMQEMSTFFEFVKAEAARRPTLSLEGLLERIDLMQKDGIALRINKTAYSDNGVNFVTTHSSKGLEFKYVFLMGCTDKAWKKTSAGGAYYAFPPNLTSQEKTDELEERRRLFYVAMTRAKEYLQISFADADREMQKQEMNRFVAELLDDAGTLPEERSVGNAELLDYQVTMMTDKARHKIELLDKPYLTKVLESYSMSVTHLNKYLKCPLKFYFESLLKVPQAKNETLAFGSAIHHALEKYFEAVDRKTRKFPELAKLLKFFDVHMHRNRESFTSRQFDQRMEYGHMVLSDYYRHYEGQWNPNVIVERRISGVEIQGVPVNGMLDKLEFEGNKVTVVDYKTGKFANAKRFNHFNRPGEKVSREAAHHIAEFGGDYWRQAVFYKLLLDNYKQQDWKVLSTVFDYVENDEKGQFHRERVEVSEQDAKQVSLQITGTYEKIMNLEFDTGCGQPDCRWCNFVQNNFRELAESHDELEFET